MFALAALITFLLVLFGVKAGFSLTVLGFVFVAAHLLLGWYPVGGAGPPWGSRNRQ